MPPATTTVPKTITITSTFQNGKPIPKRFGCAQYGGQDVSPALAFGNLPASTQALAFIMDDPDAPGGTWTHWTFWNLPAHRTSLAEGEDVTQHGAKEGEQGWRTTGYGGPCPPDREHRYFFRIYALNGMLDLPNGAKVAQLRRAMEGKLLAMGELWGTFAPA